MQRRTLRLAAVPALLVALAACSSDDSSSGSTASSPDASLIEPAASTLAPTGTEGSGSDGGLVAGTPDPCALLSAAAVATVLGDPAPAPKTAIAPEPPLNLRQCQWSVEPSDTSLRAIYLSVQTTKGFELGGLGGGQYAASDQYEGTRSGLAAAVDVTGLGDAAFFTDSSERELQVLIGDTLLGVSSQTIGSDAEAITGEQLRSLMEAAIAAL